MTVRGLFETYLTVSDLDRSVAFYRDVVGLPVALELPERGAAFVWIKNMAVAPAHRGRGIGARLIEAAVERARAEGRTTLPVATAAAAELDAIERAFAERAAPVQVEIAHLADTAVAAVFTERGYRLTSFENVLGRRLGDAVERAVPGVEVRPSGDDEFDAWFAAVAD